MRASTRALELLCAALAVTSSALADNAERAPAATTCKSPDTNVPAPSVAPGYKVRLVASGLTYPRGIMFDSAGNLLVIDSGKGLKSLKFKEKGNCITLAEQKVLLDDGSLNHGLELSPDGKTLYASSASSLYSWDYDAAGQTLSGKRTLVDGMQNSDHTTRTLLLSKKSKKPTMVISRGSTANIDPLAADKSTGHSHVRAFSLNDIGNDPVDFTTNGKLLGWGLRNSVGVTEHPTTGGIWSVENSVDELHRLGEDIHQDNPGEEMNFLGYLNGKKSREQGSNFGYPHCFSAWGVDDIPKNRNIDVGTQFVIGKPNATLNDKTCKNERTAPRLTFQAHMAPLDIKFNKQGSAAFVSFHGSWDRTTPVGYKLSVIEFANGEPVEPANSKKGAVDVVTNKNAGKCDRKPCFRPVGLTWDTKGRLWMSSDATGEIYVVDVPPKYVPSKTTSRDVPTSSPTNTDGAGTGGEGAASLLSLRQSAGALVVAVVAFCLFI